MYLADVVPWGRCLDEYIAMFALRDQDLAKKILGCSDGPASFNAELSQRGGHIISLDPVYQFNAAQIRSRIAAVRPHIMSEITKHHDDYLWHDVPNMKTLEHKRMAAMNLFLSDYAKYEEKPSKPQHSRYIAASLPHLPFNTPCFELALCSHYLFLYSAHLDAQHHLDAMLALCRVAQEVRVYPLIGLDGTPSPHLDSIITSLSQRGFAVALQPVTYQFQKGADTMLVVRQP